MNNMNSGGSEIERVLQEVGFSNAESKVYLALLKSGETKSGFLIKKTSLQSSVVHNALNSLIDKGFAAYVLKGKIKHYSALEPKIIKEYVEAKRKEFLQIFPALESLKEESEQETASAEVYEGYKGLFAATLSLLESAKKGDVYKYFAIPEMLISKEALDFFVKVDLIKKQRGIIVKGISELILTLSSLIVVVVFISPVLIEKPSLTNSEKFPKHSVTLRSGSCSATKEATILLKLPQILHQLGTFLR